MSAAEDTSLSKKAKLEHPAVPLRYTLTDFPSLTISRDREHSTIIASNFPENTTEEQVRYFFKDVSSPQEYPLMGQCGTIRNVRDTSKSGISFVIEFEKEV